MKDAIWDWRTYLPLRLYAPHPRPKQKLYSSLSPNAKTIPAAGAGNSFSFPFFDLRCPPPAAADPRPRSEAMTCCAAAFIRSSARRSFGLTKPCDSENLQLKARSRQESVVRVKEQIEERCEPRNKAARLDDSLARTTSKKHPTGRGQANQRSTSIALSERIVEAASSVETVARGIR